MIYIAWVVSLVASFLLGYHYHSLNHKVAIIEEAVKMKIDKKAEIEPTSSLIDPLDPIKEALYQHDKMMKRLNPDE